MIIRRVVHQRHHKIINHRFCSSIELTLPPTRMQERWWLWPDAPPAEDEEEQRVKHEFENTNFTNKHYNSDEISRATQVFQCPVLLSHPGKELQLIREVVQQRKKERI